MPESGKPRVLIAGAGLSGLTIAQCLRKQGIPFEIFDRDPDIVTRKGTAIGIHTMLDDLKSLFPSDMPSLEESAGHLKPLKLEPQISFYFHEPRVAVQNTPETPCMRVNRLRFRQWLATNIPIQWGKWVRRVEEEGKVVTVHFEDGTSASGDILIGADGINSVAREYLLGRPNSEVLNPIKMSSIQAKLTLSGEAFERQLSLSHSSYALSPKALNGGFIFVGLNKVNEDFSGEYYWWVAWNDEDADKADHWLKNASAQAKYDWVMKRAETLEPRFKELFDLTPVSGVDPGAMILRDLIMPPLPPTGRIILVGDAAHAMTPFRGEGGVHAIRDALKISKGLSQINLEDSTDVGATLDPYQQEILERGREAVLLSRGAAAHNIEHAKSTITAWGHVAKVAPAEHILLDQIKP